MRVITVDNGNTNPHVGIFENEKLINVIPLNEFQKKPDDFIIISDVGRPLNFKASFDLKTKRHSKANPFFFDMPVQYTETLGDDRLIASYLPYKELSGNETILIIDAGTFITIDAVSSQGFLGGFIFPGLKTFLSSYKKGTQLSELEFKELTLADLPHSTEEAILGAANFYLESILAGLIKKTSPSKIVITGGSSELITKKIKNLNLSKVQLETYPHLIHSSLFLIYQTHLRSK